MTETSRARPASGIRIDAERLRRRREQVTLSRKELAEATGVTRDCIAKLENGKRRPKPDTLRKLCNALGITPDDLLPFQEGEEQS